MPEFGRFGATKSAAFETAVLVWLVAMLYWLVSHPFEGLYHDALVYAVLVARYIDPVAFGPDLLFLGGAQDSLNLFSPLYFWLIQWLGFDNAAKSIVAVGGLLWVSGALVFSRRALPRAIPSQFLAILLAIATYAYAPNAATFQLNESFATARVLAFPLVLWAFAAWFSVFPGRRLVALFLTLLAMALHPLVGLWPLLIFLFEYLSDRFVVALVLAGGLTLFGLSAVDGLPRLAPMDDEWAGIVRMSTRDVFVGQWGTVQLGRFLGVIGLLWLAGRLGTPERRRTYLLVAMLVGWMFLLAQVCSYWYPIQLVIQAQPWRVLAIGIIFAMLAAVDVGWRAWQQGRVLFALMLALAMPLWAYWPATYGLLFLPILLSMFRQFRARWQIWTASLQTIGPRLSGGVFVGLCLWGFAFLPGYWLDLEVRGGGLVTHWWLGMDGLRGIVLGGSPFFIFVLLYLSRGAWLRRMLIAIVLPLTVLAAIGWDNRIFAARVFEGGVFQTNERWDALRRWIPPGDVLAWPGQHRIVWFELGRANYVSPDQLIGIVFSRERTMEGQRRAERLAISTQLRAIDSGDKVEVALNKYLKRYGHQSRGTLSLHGLFEGTPTIDGLGYLCADPKLDWVVSTHNERGGRVRSQHAFSFAGQPHYLYSCRAMRERSATGMTL